METRRGRKSQINSSRNTRNPVNNANCYEERTKSGSSDSSEGEIEFEGWVEFVTKKDGSGNGRNEKVMKGKVSNGMIDMRKNSNKYGICNEYGKSIESSKHRRNGHRKDIQYIDSNGRQYRQVTTPMIHVHKQPQMVVNTMPGIPTQVQHIQHQNPTNNNYVIQQEMPQMENHQAVQIIPTNIKKDAFMIEPSNPIYVNPVHPSVVKNQQTFPQVYIRQPPTVIISNQPRPPLIINPPPANVILKNQAPQPIYVNHSRPNVIIKNEPAALNYPTNMDSVPIQLEHPQQYQGLPKGIQIQNEPLYPHPPPNQQQQQQQQPQSQHQQQQQQQQQQQIHLQGNGKTIISKMEPSVPMEVHNNNHTVSFMQPNVNVNGPAMQNEYVQYGNTFEIKTQTPPPNVIMMNPNENFHQMQNGTMQQQIVTMNEMDRSYIVQQPEATQNEIFVNEPTTYQFQQPPMQIQQHIQMEPMPTTTTTMMQINPREYVTQEILMQPPQVEEYTTMPIPVSYEQPFNQTMQEVAIRNTQPIMFHNSQPMIPQMIQQPHVVQQSHIVQPSQMMQQVGSPLRYTQTFTPTKVNMTPSRITHIQQNPPINQVQVRNPTPMNYVVTNPNPQYVQTINQPSPNRNMLCTPLRRNYTMNVNANRINNNLAPKVQILAKPVPYRNPNNATCR